MTLCMNCPGCQRPTPIDALRCPTCRGDIACRKEDAREEPLTACKDCMNHIPVGTERNRCHAVRARTFDAINGEFTVGERLFCIKVNTDGHCPHFQRREE